MSRVYRNEKPVVDVNQWMNNPNGSIFIKYIPNHITKTNLRNMFSFLGVISRIDIVNISDGGSGRRAFIHFTEWTPNEMSLNVRTDIAKKYPIHSPLIMDSFEFSITLNIRPIPPTELNPQQLSDWSQRLNDELVDFKTSTTENIDRLVAENAGLRNELNSIKTTLAFFMNQPLQPYYYQPFQPYYEQPIESYYYDDPDQPEEEYCEMESHFPSEFPDLTEGDLAVMEEFEKEIEIDELRTVGEQTCDENNMDEITDMMDSVIIDVADECDIFDLDSIEAGFKRARDPLIFERSVRVC